MCVVSISHSSVRRRCFHVINYTLHFIVVSVEAALLVETGSSLSMTCPQEKANEFCSVWQIANSILGRGPASEIASMLGLPDHDERWCTPYGQDVTHLCVRSDNGGFSSNVWTVDGWVLDDESMWQLVDEFPFEFYYVM